MLRATVQLARRAYSSNAHNMVLVEERSAANGKVAIITLDRPKVNAINGVLCSRITEAVRHADANHVDGIVITGKPGIFSAGKLIFAARRRCAVSAKRACCAGFDIPFLMDLDRKGVETFWTLFNEALITIATCKKPLFVAISGHAPAGGCVLSLPADYRIACHGDFKIGLNEVGVGVPIPSGMRAHARTMPTCAALTLKALWRWPARFSARTQR
jgi:3,2-trans-enoyl-CoA isomerase